MTMMEDGNLKTVEGQFLHELETEFGFTLLWQGRS